MVLSVDLRHPDRGTLDSMIGNFRSRVEAIAASTAIVARVEQIWHMPATQFAPQLIGLIEDAAQRLGYDYQRIVSGAGHDSLHVAQFAPTAMIFVPCAGGLSHNEEESAKPEDLAAGANVLLQAVVAAANQ